MNKQDLLELINEIPDDVDEILFSCTIEQGRGTVTSTMSTGEPEVTEYDDDDLRNYFDSTDGDFDEESYEKLKGKKVWGLFLEGEEDQYQ